MLIGGNGMEKRLETMRFVGKEEGRWYDYMGRIFSSFAEIYNYDYTISPLWNEKEPFRQNGMLYRIQGYLEQHLNEEVIPQKMFYMEPVYLKQQEQEFGYLTIGKFDDNTMDSIEPFDYTDLTDFNLSYLSGFLSEKYDVSVDTASIRAKERIQNSIIQELKSTINGYHSVSLCHSNFDVNVDTTEYVLLPVWMLNIKYQENLYLFAMNGQTGKIIGDIPVDNKKFFTKWIKIFLEYFLLISIILFILMLIF